MAVTRVSKIIITLEDTFDFTTWDLLTQLPIGFMVDVAVHAKNSGWKLLFGSGYRNGKGAFKKLPVLN